MEPLTTFTDWVGAQPELQTLRRSIHANPTGALAPVVPQVAPPLGALQATGGEGLPVPLEEQKMVLSYRKGASLHRNTILKAYHMPRSESSLKVESLPVYTLGSPSVDMLKAFLDSIGCSPGGNGLAVITDITEELTVYIKGKPYVRRELEMPARALHHAGISYSKLQEMEFSLAQDASEEVRQWGGRLLVHHELEKVDLRALGDSGRVGSRLGSVLKRPSAGDQAAAGKAPHHLRSFKSASEITQVVDKNPGAAVVGMWETDLSSEPEDIYNGVTTTKQVFIHLRKMGYRVKYKRIPMSRDRTPVASDIDHLQLQLRSSSPSDNVSQVIMSRTMAGSSCRYVASLLAMFMLKAPLDAQSADDDGGRQLPQAHAADAPVCRGGAPEHPAPPADARVQPRGQAGRGRCHLPLRPHRRYPRGHRPLLDRGQQPRDKL
uniref:Paladin-like isoform x3 n=1 Tax=Tetraselmis sp. GSL018 TaxID=582737 RepID=A0A061RKB2_9CHLO